MATITDGYLITIPTANHIAGVYDLNQIPYSGVDIFTHIPTKNHIVGVMDNNNLITKGVRNTSYYFWPTID